MIDYDVPINDLAPHPANPRRGNVSAIAESILTNGWHGAVVAQRSTKRILVGKHRWEALKALGRDTIPVVQWRDVDDVEALRIIVADNRASDLASYDDAHLLQNLKDLGSGQGTLFDEEAIDALTIKVEGIPLVADHEFKGDYADAGEEEQARAVAAERAGKEMKDVVLAMRPDQYADFINNVKALQKRWGLSGVIATVIMAVDRAANIEQVTATDEDKMVKMKTLLVELEWAVPPDRKKDYLEAMV